MDSGRFAWALQERLKGRLPLGWFVGSNYCGWGFNSEWNVNDPSSTSDPPDTVTMPSSQANQIPISDLKAKPFFMKGLGDSDLFTVDNLASSAIDGNRRARLLAEAFPSMTLAAGANPTSAFDLQLNNFDMQVKFRRPNIWPADRSPNNWRHSDIREIAYPYVYSIFDDFAIRGGLRQ